MKKKVFWQQFLIFGLLIGLFSGCSGEEKRLFSNDDEPIATFSASWSENIVKDTIILTCDQTVEYTFNGSSHSFHPKAYVKFWAEKDTIAFNKDENPKPVYKTASGSTPSNGSQPKRQYIIRQFEFTDGQVIKSETMFESYVFSIDGAEKTFPFAEINEPAFSNASAAELASNDNLFKAVANFNISWQARGTEESGTQHAAVSYIKKATSDADALLNTAYNKGSEWLSDNLFSLYVEKVETWKIAGIKSEKHSSPALEFVLNGKENKELTVENFDFSGTCESSQTKKQDISSNGWALKKGIVTQTVMLDNARDRFEDAFDYPMYEASYALDGKTFDFDLSVKFDESHQVATVSETRAFNSTAATAIVLNKTFTSTVTTTLNKKSAVPDPDPDPDPDPEPGPKHGQILGYNVSAVFDVSQLSSKGRITKKCVVVRYETGYDWGVCAYNEAFPAEMTYVQSGYTGFNSAAMSSATSPFRIARAKDIPDGIMWYAEDNSVICALDILTCKILGWLNIVDGKYSSVIKGYTENYSSSRYSLTLTAPNGATKTFKSSPQ